MQLIALDLTYISSEWWTNTDGRFALVSATTIAFAALAHLLRGVTLSGAVAGVLVCFTLFAGVGPGAFAALFSVFAMTWLATRTGMAQKQRRGTAEHSEGRNASQVLANIGVAAACAAAYASLRRPEMIFAMAAALAEPAADTVSSECGQAFSEDAYLITTFERVPAGTDGGVSVAGTACGVVAAGLLAEVCFLGGMFSARQLWIPAAGGIFGMVADSYLGALVEQRGWLGNDAVNFLGTLLAAGAALGLARL